MFSNRILMFTDWIAFIQVHIPSISYLREAFGERLELIVIQAQIPTNNYLREAFRERLELIVTQALSHFQSCEILR